MDTKKLVLLCGLIFSACSNEITNLDNQIAQETSLELTTKSNDTATLPLVDNDSTKVIRLSKSDFPIKITSNGEITKNVALTKAISLDGPYTIQAGAGTLNKQGTEKIRLLPSTVSGTRLTAGVYPCDVYKYSASITVPSGADVICDDPDPCGYYDYYAQELGTELLTFGNTATLSYYSLLINYNILGQYIGEFVFPIDLRETTFVYYYVYK